MINSLSLEVWPWHLLLNYRKSLSRLLHAWILSILCKRMSRRSNRYDVHCPLYELISSDIGILLVKLTNLFFSHNQVDNILSTLVLVRRQLGLLRCNRFD